MIFSAKPDDVGAAPARTRRYRWLDMQLHTNCIKCWLTPNSNSFLMSRGSMVKVRIVGNKLEKVEDKFLRTALPDLYYGGCLT